MHIVKVRLVVLGALVLFTGAAFSQATYPAKQIRMIVGFAPGGGSDIFARALAQRLSATFGQPVVIDVLLVHPSVPAKSVRELIALAKRTRGELNYGSAGNGSGTHLVTEYFLTMSGARMTHVPYKGGILALSALLTGEVEVVFDPIVTTMAQVNTGRITFPK